MTRRWIREVGRETCKLKTRLHRRGNAGQQNSNQGRVTSINVSLPGMDVPRVDLLIHTSAPSGAKDDARYRKEVAAMLAFELLGRRIELTDSRDQPARRVLVESEKVRPILNLSQELPPGSKFSSSVTAQKGKDREKIRSRDEEVSFESRRLDPQGAARLGSEDNVLEFWKRKSSLLPVAKETPNTKLPVVQVERTDERPRSLEQVRWNTSSTRVVDTPVRGISGPFSSPIESSSKSSHLKRAASTSPTSIAKRQKVDTEIGRGLHKSRGPPDQSSDIPTVSTTPLHPRAQLYNSSDDFHVRSRFSTASSETGLPSMEAAVTSPIREPWNKPKHDKSTSSSVELDSAMMAKSSTSKKKINKQKSEGGEVDAHSPSALTSPRQMGPQNEVGFLPAVREKLPLENHYRPKIVSRQLREHERGYWRIDTLTWDRKRKNRFWKMLREEIIRGLCGWGVWATRRDNEMVEIGKSNGSSVIKVHCWGGIVGDIWLVLYMTSEGKVKGTNAAWVDSSGLTVVEMD